MIAAAALWLAAMQQGAAIEIEYSHAFGACMKTGDAARGVTAGILDCLGEENARQDRALNAAYKRAMARLSATRRAKLRSDQRRWIAARPRLCSERDDVREGGSLSAIAYANCFLDRTITWTLYLDRVSMMPSSNSLAPPAPPR